jgi:hypothetical protein
MWAGATDAADITSQDIPEVSYNLVKISHPWRRKKNARIPPSGGTVVGVG